MSFPKRYGEFAARLRVPAGFVIALLFLLLARPNWRSLAIGGAVAVLGLLLRAWAAGHLAKYQALSTSGPFAHMRNPLYVGTLIVGAGFAIAGSSLPAGLLLALFFVLFYLPVIEEEERYLRGRFPEFSAYESKVPRFWPALAPRYSSGVPFRLDLFRRNREYQALVASVAALGLLAAKAMLFPR